MNDRNATLDKECASAFWVCHCPEARSGVALLSSNRTVKPLHKGKGYCLKCKKDQSVSRPIDRDRVIYMECKVMTTCVQRGVIKDVKDGIVTVFIHKDQYERVVPAYQVEILTRKPMFQKS